MVWLAGLFGLAALGGMALADLFSEDDDLADDKAEADQDPLGLETGMETGPLSPADWIEGVTGTTGDVPGDPVEGAAESGPAGLILSGGPEVDFLSGGDGNDLLDGAAGQDQINGYGGDDWIRGGAGDDRLFGADGDDLLDGGGGEDQLHGGYGDDDLEGAAGEDQLFGHAGADRLEGGSGADRMEGGLGDDVLRGGDGDDALHGSEGDDFVEGGAGADTLFGGWGDDTLSGLEPGEAPGIDDLGGIGGSIGAANAADSAAEDTSGSDFLNGGSGADTIFAGAGDVVTAGEDADGIVLGDWIAGGDAAELLDYDPAEDQLTLVWDMESDPDPEVEVVTDPASPGLSHIMVNGAELARVQGGGPVTVEDIRLVDYTALPDLSPADR
ncbi:calcium-binding protein [Antarcticimicrobium luteum]|uniref:Calcium-binding protein n=1 Tax=Antarcticimicrobium luteum TaxID=2547397 RepID=A0A4R5V3J3_9RHOB|nr:calcium-binding protein [Antarcticimicrobium luteum]TDK46251.1 calcium-binding protein [Antarcticimicrobium luteum]